MKCLESRKASFLIVTAIYIAATLLGVGVYLLLPFNFWLNLLLADIIATVFTFIFSVLFSNSSVYDPYWSVQPIVIVVEFAISYGITLNGVCLLVAICLWGIRLTANWAYTFHSFAEYQDWRYVQLKEQTKWAYPIVNFLGIHMVPTLIVYACVLPACFVFVYAPAFHIATLCFSLFSIGAATLQTVADIQMHTFRKNKTTTFIRVGLWKYARHPNYLGEILMWWGIGLACVFALQSNWYLLTGAVANTLLFICVSVPLADNHQKRKEGFAEYKKRTHVFLPIKK